MHLILHSHKYHPGFFSFSFHFLALFVFKWRWFFGILVRLATVCNSQCIVYRTYYFPCQVAKWKAPAMQCRNITSFLSPSSSPSISNVGVSFRNSRPNVCVFHLPFNQHTTCCCLLPLGIHSEWELLLVFKISAPVLSAGKCYLTSSMLKVALRVEALIEREKFCFQLNTPLHCPGINENDGRTH